MMHTLPAHADAPVEKTDATQGDRRRIDSHTLFAGSTEIVISHAGATYRLRITRQGKLILTK